MTGPRILFFKSRIVGRPWSGDDDAKLSDLIKAGIDLEKIADQLHRPISNIKERIEELKLNAESE